MSTTVSANGAGGSTTCAGASVTTVRSASCRATRPVNAVRSASTSSAPRRVNPKRTWYSTEVGSNRWKNQKRCCEKESGSARSRGAGTITSPLGASAPLVSEAARSATAATVRASNRVLAGSATPSAALIFGITRNTSSELPPREKKSSCTPTRSTPSTSAQIQAMAASVALRGGVCSFAVGAGSAERSTLPLTASGSRSSATNTVGTMCSGRSPARKSRRTSADGADRPAPSGAT
jgi:hypothetical protein